MQDISNLPTVVGNESVQPMSGSSPRGRLYTVEQVSEQLGLPVTWIYERTRRDAIPHRKIGKYVRFSEEDIRQMLAMWSRGSQPATRTVE
jgi:excisionase family DNA binding protein